MRISSLTWNTHGICAIPTFSTVADIIVVSLQECPSPPERKLSTHPYHRVYSLCGLQTLIWSKHPIKTRILKFGLGPFRLLNKGFIAVTINEDVLHINTHLIAHPHNNKKRCAQIDDILAYSFRNTHSTVILSGDFNFRCVFGKDQSELFTRKYEAFREAPINFKPTYKYKGSAIDLRREPSYCDRIFVASNRTVTFERYTSFQHITTSDHKPVILTMTLGVCNTGMQLLDIEQKNPFWNEILGYFYESIWNGKMYLAGIILGLLLLYILRYFIFSII